MANPGNTEAPTPQNSPQGMQQTPVSTGEVEGATTALPAPTTPQPTATAPAKPRKKVLFLITKATWGGAQRYVYDLVTHLPTDEYHPIVAFGVEGQLAEMLRAAHIETIALPKMGRDIALVDDISAFNSALEIIGSLKPDIVHLNSSKAAALGALAARMRGVQRIVFTVHGWPFKENRGALSRWFIYFASWFTAMCAHSVIVVSKEDEMIGKKMSRVAEKISYVPLGIDPPAFLTREEARQFFRARTSSDKVPSNSVVVGTIAEMTPNKGLGIGIEAFADMRRDGDKNYVYIIIGDGEQRKELEDIARNHNIAENVLFLGFIPNAARYMKGFDIFLLPSEKEGMPYVLLEAGEAGITAVTTIKKDEDLALLYPRLNFTLARNPYSISDAIRALHLEEPDDSIPHAPRFPLSLMVRRILERYSES